MFTLAVCHGREASQSLYLYEVFLYFTYGVQCLVAFAASQFLGFTSIFLHCALQAAMLRSAL